MTVLPGERLINYFMYSNTTLQTLKGCSCIREGEGELAYHCIPQRAQDMLLPCFFVFQAPNVGGLINGRNLDVLLVGRLSFQHVVLRMY